MVRCARNAVVSPPEAVAEIDDAHPPSPSRIAPKELTHALSEGDSRGQYGAAGKLADSAAICNGNVRGSQR